MKAIDLGLSVKWCDCNIGASSPEDNGHYFSWGEILPKNYYDGSTYKWGTATYNVEYDDWDLETLTKYNTRSRYGTVDNKTVLDLEDDAAAVNWGGQWRMPTDAEWTELSENCTWTWTTLNGRIGYEVKSKTNGNHIFLPAAGYRSGDDLSYAGYYGCYWSSSLDTGYPDRALDVDIRSNGVYRVCSGRYYGLSVRPIYK